MNGQNVKKFLVVNNDLALGESVRRILEETFAVEVDLESECSKAIERLSQQDYEIVIANFSLADGDCFDLMKEIAVKEIDTHPIVVVPRGDEYLAARSLQCGALGSAARYRNYFRELREAVATALADYVMKD